MDAVCTEFIVSVVPVFTHYSTNALIRTLSMSQVLTLHPQPTSTRGRHQLPCRISTQCRQGLLTLCHLRCTTTSTTHTRWAQLDCSKLWAFTGACSDSLSLHLMARLLLVVHWSQSAKLLYLRHDEASKTIFMQQTLVYAKSFIHQLLQYSFAAICVCLPACVFVTILFFKLSLT